MRVTGILPAAANCVTGEPGVLAGLLEREHASLYALIPAQLSATAIAISSTSDWRPTLITRSPCIARLLNTLYSHHSCTRFPQIAAKRFSGNLAWHVFEPTWEVNRKTSGFRCPHLLSAARVSSPATRPCGTPYAMSRSRCPSRRWQPAWPRAEYARGSS